MYCVMSFPDKERIMRYKTEILLLLLLLMKHSFHNPWLLFGGGCYSERSVMEREHCNLQFKAANHKCAATTIAVEFYYTLCVNLRF